MRRSVLLFWLPSHMWLFSFHPVLSEAPTAPRAIEDVMPFDPKRALFGGMEAYQQGYV